MATLWDSWGIEAYIQNRLNELFSYDTNVPSTALIADASNAPDTSNAVARRPAQSSLRKVGQARLDLIESPFDLTVRVDLPGVSKDDVKVHLEQNDQVLSIEAERHEHHEEEFPKSSQSGEQQQLRYHYAERAYGRVARRVWLPAQVDASKIQSNFKDGVLEVRLGKKVEDEKRKRITLQ